MASTLRMYPILVYALILTFAISKGSPLYPDNGGTAMRPVDGDSLRLNFSTVYRGHRYQELWISKDGMLAFSDREKYVSGVNWSSPSVSRFIDRPFIAPFYYDGKPLNVQSGYTGRISYVIRKPGDGYQPSLRELGQYIRSQTVGSNSFDPDSGLMVTWNNVADSKQTNCKATLSVPCLTNNFQLVLLSDGTGTYTIVNYGSMDIPVNNYFMYQAGFNGGNGTGWTPVYPSGGISQLGTGKGSNMTGRYIFQVSSPAIVRGGCSSDTSLKELSIYPSYAGMFGGKVIDISGPCFTKNQRIICRFGDLGKGNDTAVFVSQNLIRCTVPRLLERGWLSLSVSTNNGMTYPYKADFFVADLGSAHIDGDMAPWYTMDAQTLSVSWDPSLLNASTNARVDIGLYGYREVNGQGHYGFLRTLGSTLPNDGTFTFDTAGHSCTGQTCMEYELGLLEVRLQPRYSPAKYRYLSTEALPLGWYVNRAMVSRYGSNWPAAKCSSWYNTDKLATDWLEDQPSCPCTLNQALADFGRWQADSACTIKSTNRPGNCKYHTEALHCVISVLPVRDGDSQCCYGHNHMLIYTSDSYQGSSPDRSSSWGSPPYLSAGRVPNWSHYIRDVVPFYYCCLWTNYGSCDDYMKLRPTRDCPRYIPPAPASVFGQGHVVTFGGQMTRMYGPGDYTLLKSGNTVVQGRFQPNLFPTETGSMVTTSFPLSAVCIHDNGTSDVVDIRLTPPNYAIANQFIEIRVNNEYVPFHSVELYRHDFKGVSIFNTDGGSPNRQSNFTVLLSNGIAFQVAAINHILELDVMVPEKFSGRVTGLFGDLFGNLATPTGMNVTLYFSSSNDQQLPESPSYVYNDYQLAWAVNDSERLFRDTTFYDGPVDLTPTPVPFMEGMAQRFCREDRACLFDYMNTGSQKLAEATYRRRDRNAFLARGTQRVRSCGLLDVQGISKSSHNYFLDSSIDLIGCKSGDLSGPAQYKCVATSNTSQAWYPAVSTTCTVTTESANLGIIVGIVIAAVVLVIVAIVLVSIVLRRRRHNRESKPLASYSADETKVVRFSAEESTVGSYGTGKNTVVGYDADKNKTDVSGSVKITAERLDADKNTAVGYGANNTAFDFSPEKTNGHHAYENTDIQCGADVITPDRYGAKDNAAFEFSAEETEDDGYGAYENTDIPCGTDENTTGRYGSNENTAFHSSPEKIKSADCNDADESTELRYAVDNNSDDRYGGNDNTAFHFSLKEKTSDCSDTDENPEFRYVSDDNSDDRFGASETTDFDFTLEDFAADCFGAVENTDVHYGSDEHTTDHNGTDENTSSQFAREENSVGPYGTDENTASRYGAEQNTDAPDENESGCYDDEEDTDGPDVDSDNSTGCYILVEDKAGRKSPEDTKTISTYSKWTTDIF